MAQASPLSLHLQSRLLINPIQSYKRCRVAVPLIAEPHDPNLCRDVERNLVILADEP
jgi:hypothetical protein